MKQHSKLGNRPGKPAYRTSSVFRYKKAMESAGLKARFKEQKAKRQ